MHETLFNDTVKLFSSIHADASEGKPQRVSALFKTALVAGVPVIDISELAPAVDFDRAVIDDESMVRRHDIVRNLELTLSHISLSPSSISQKFNGITYTFAARTEEDVLFEDNSPLPTEFNYTFIAIDGEASAFVIVIGDGKGGVDAVIRCPAGISVTSSVHPGVVFLCKSIAESSKFANR